MRKMGLGTFSAVPFLLKAYTASEHTQGYRSSSARRAGQAVLIGILNFTMLNLNKDCPLRFSFWTSIGLALAYASLKDTLHFARSSDCTFNRQMFSNKTAWFSESCHTLAQRTWVEKGGKLEDISLAQFIFSDNWECHDTNSLLTSEAYLNQHLAVFSSQYVADAAKHGSGNVILGDYFLVPDKIRECLEHRVTYESALNGNGEKYDGSQVHLARDATLPSQPFLRPGDRGHRARYDQSQKKVFRPPSSQQGPCGAERAQHPASDSSTSPPNSKKRREAPSSSHLGTSSVEYRVPDEGVPHVKDLPKCIKPLKIIRPEVDNVEVLYY
ncbi:uncharacterized protein LOC101846856 isoform X2 [Aplysia californica]|uniref:Uncharacterized protein LOC101846856 isoform X2 n=1 Tax=Aplysia californica TaxID=6500 RepID=A0ABM0JCE3_APLCA|nr:uncharacterized protein LOC101846856 isoform X2 [Aplysia californica]